MYKKILLFTSLSLLSISVFSQTSARVAKALTDPERINNEARADLYSQPKLVTNDTAQVLTVTNEKATIKKHHYKRKKHS